MEGAGMNMCNRVIMSSLVFLLSDSHNINAGQVKPVDDLFNPLSFQTLNQSRESLDAEMQSCASDNVAVVTIYSTTGAAQVGIDVKIDNSPVGSLTTHFPDAGPECKTPSSDGVITVIIPAGRHTLDAESINMAWPSYSFEIEKCECLSLPLS
jgi:hypothetical protein